MGNNFIIQSLHISLRQSRTIMELPFSSCPTSLPFNILPLETSLIVLLAMASNLIHGDPWEKQPEQLSAKREMQRIAEDIGIITKWLVDEFSAAGISRKLGIMGFGYGGGRVIDVLAQDEGACFSIGASLYGTEVDPSVASKVKVPVLLISGDNDPLCPVSVMKDLEKGMGEGSKLVIFEGRGHGFVHNPGSPEEDEDAEQAFLMLRNWLHHGLVATNI